MKKIKVGVTGLYGKMGHELKTLIMADQNFELVQTLKGAHVWIDFSSPEGFRQTLEKCTHHKIPLVSGTTGLKKSDFVLLKKMSKKIPVFWASNMSIGIAILKRSLMEWKNFDASFDFEIIETHHRHKKDAPSGTAKTIHEHLEAVVQKKIPIPHSLRIGGVFGEHVVIAASDEEVIKYEHQALNRRIFARGALQAARWLLKQNNGLYNMDMMISHQNGVK